MLGPLGHSECYEPPTPPSPSVLRVGHQLLRAAPEGVARTPTTSCSQEFFNQEASCAFTVAHLSMI